MNNNVLKRVEQRRKYVSLIGGTSMNEKVLNRVEQHYKYICEIYGEGNVLGTFLYGSQNYGCDTPNSDIDTYSIIIPTPKQAFFDTPISKEHLMPDNAEHANAKDIREMIKMYYKQNINFLETLFTQYKVVNNKYEVLWEEILDLREFIAHYDVKRCIASIVGQALHTINHNTDFKKLANAYRLKIFLIKHCQDGFFEINIKLSDEQIEYFQKIKTGAEFINKQELIEDFNFFSRNVNNIILDAHNNWRDPDKLREEIKDIVTKLIFSNQ